MNRDLNDVNVVQSITPAAVRTATVTGSSVDLRGYDSAQIDVLYGIITDGSWLASVDESDDDSTFTAVAAADLLGTAFAAKIATSPEAAAIQTNRYKGAKRYIRVVITLTATVSPTVGGPMSAVVVRGHPARAGKGIS